MASSFCSVVANRSCARFTRRKVTCFIGVRPSSLRHNRRKCSALREHAAAGKGNIMHHPGTWYGYREWPELNAQIGGGGSRGHDKIQEFFVNAVRPDDPIMQGVPASFAVVDELYYINAEPEKIPAGTAAITVLAETSPSKKFNAPQSAV